MKKFIEESYRRLNHKFGAVSCPLHYKHPHELAVAVILSAQCTDEQVNKVTPALFEAFPAPEDYYKAPLAKVEKLIYSTGFYKNKAKSIRGFCKMYVEEFGGEMPKTLKELTSMPGVGRKTANVILQELFRIPSGVVVDTHVVRLSNLFGLTKSKNPIIIERDLMKALPEKYWIDWTLYMIFLGRSNCTAKKRFCADCILADICPAREENAPALGG